MSTVPGVPGIRKASDAEPRDGRGYWLASLIRAIAALIIGIGITFMADHSSALGLRALGAYALVSGAVLLVFRARASTDQTTVTLFTVAGAASLVTGVAALLLADTGTATLVYLGAAFAAVCGGLELAAGLRDRGRNRAAADWIVVGGATLLLAAALLLVPPELADAFRGERGNTGVMTGSIMAVGLIGAWAVIVGVVLAIGTVTLRGRAPRTETAESAASEETPS